MAQKSNNTALAIAVQADVDVFETITQPGDLMPVSNCRLSIDGVTIANDEYTGSVAKNADVVAGKRVGLSYNVKLRPPGGADVPAANAYLPGRVLQAAKMTELRTTTAIPAAAEAVAGGTTTSITLGAGATATADLYNAMPVLIEDSGATVKAQLTAIRDYTAGKVATLFETLADAPTGDYQIPKHLAYMRDVSSDDPIFVSHSLWMGGDRYDLKNCRLTSLQIMVPVSTKDQAAYPEIQCTWDCTIDAHEAEAAPAVPPAGAIPLYKDGKLWVAATQVGGSTFTVDLGIQSENPPNPNNEDGVDAPELIASTARLSMTRQKYAQDVFDTLALADAQAYHGFLAQWGLTSGNIVQVLALNGRFNYQNPDLGGGIVMESGDLMIDADARGVAIVFPYPTVLT